MRPAPDHRQDESTLLLDNGSVAIARAVLAVRNGERAQMEPGDLLALTYVAFHLAHRIAPPVEWAVEAINSSKLRYQVSGARAEAVVAFLLDYAATPFRAGDLSPGKLARYFDWYLSVKAATVSVGRAAGYEPSDSARDKLARDKRRFYAACTGGPPREATLRRAWEEPIRQLRASR